MNKAPDPFESIRKQLPQWSNETSAEEHVLSHECKLVRTAQAMLQRRRRRSDEFEPTMFGEPAWEMLLALYVRETSGASSTAEELQPASATASSAERWLRYLEKEGLARRRYYPGYGRTFFVELSDRGRQALDRYLGAVGELNLSLQD